MNEKTLRNRLWFELYFGKDYLKTYPSFDSEITKVEAEFIIDTLSLPPNSIVLDLGCGIGRHAVILAEHGYRVVGLDYSSAFIETGRKKAQEKGLKIDFVREDMRSMRYRNRFDGIYSYSTSFGYFSDQENFVTLSNIARALKKNGKFLIDVQNREWLIRNFKHRFWQKLDDGTLFLNEVVFNLETSRVHAKQFFIKDKHSREYNIQYRLYSYTELVQLLRTVGLTPIRVLGNKRGEDYTIDSQRLIILSVKGPR